MISLKKLQCPCGCGLGPNLDFYGRINLFRGAFGHPMVITRGASCPAHNAKVGGRSGSSHLEGRAADVKLTPELAAFCTEANLEKLGLYMEDPAYTAAGGGWRHLSDKAPKSGKRVFIP